MASSSLLFSARYETIGGILYRYSSSRDAEISNNVGYRDVLPRVISAQNYLGPKYKEQGIPRAWRDSVEVQRGGPMQVRVLIVDDSKATRRVLSAIVSSRWTVCGQAENGKSAVKKFRELRPDLVLLDLAMPDIDGIEAGRQMHAIDPSVPLVLFTLLDP